MSNDLYNIVAVDFDPGVLAVSVPDKPDFTVTVKAFEPLRYVQHRLAVELGVADEVVEFDTPLEPTDETFTQSVVYGIWVEGPDIDPGWMLADFTGDPLESEVKDLDPVMVWSSVEAAQSYIDGEEFLPSSVFTVRPYQES